MSSVEVHLPPDCLIQDATEHGWQRLGVNAVRTATGANVELNDLGGAGLSMYGIQIHLMKTTRLEEWDAFIAAIRDGARPFWGLETNSRRHARLRLGPPGDGSRTTFPLSCFNASSVQPFIDNEPQLGTTYTLHDSANVLLDDNQWNATTDASRWTAFGSYILRGQSTGAVVVGQTAVQCQMSASAANVGLYSAAADYAVVDPSQEYTFGNMILGAGDFYTTITFYDSGKVQTGSPTNGSSTTCAADEWTGLSVATATSPADAAYAKLTTTRSTDSANPFWAGAFFLAPGDYDRAHQPSVAPSLIEFDSAPAADSELWAVATGRKCARLAMLKPGSFSWRGMDPQFAIGASIAGLEIIEKEWP